MSLDKVQSFYGLLKTGFGKVVNVSSKIVSAVVDPAMGKVRELNGKIC